MRALGFHQYLFTLSKIDLFIAALLVIFHMVHLVYVVLLLLRVHSLNNGCRGGKKNLTVMTFNMDLRGGRLEWVRQRGAFLLWMYK